VLTPPPLALYVHLPWCVRKCPYCDFNSHQAPPLVPQAQYVDALLEDLELDAPAATGRRVTSVFFGGGTPSLFSPEEIARFLAGARARVEFSADAEITLEANPGTIEHGRFPGYRDAGVNRVSLGAQSFSNTHLQALGRIHGAAEIARSVDEMREARLDNFNLDLMYGLPGQTLAEALADVDAAIALAPAHLSHYQLTLEPGTVFYHRPPPLPDAEATWEMQVECQARLARAGYAQYEISAYARPARQCTHNLNYWRFGDYIGVGAGAHGKLTRGRTIERTVRVKQPREYLARAGEGRVAERVAVEPRELPFEFMLNALRLNAGFDRVDFEQRTGLALDAASSALASAEQRGLLERIAGEHWRPTELGRRFLNDLQAMFLEPQGQPGARARESESPSGNASS
jgi:putative oxygen-independent coproporphyrinogen III oxidase